jgi:predicted RNA-binding Zn-ribbon protein involved in translation (DUF1610 family)
VQEELASVRGLIDLSPQVALNEVQDFLTKQGYSVAHRTATTLSVERRGPDDVPGQESALKLVVTTIPQPEGGVRIRVNGNDREGVRTHQDQWLGWSESLPRKEISKGQSRAPDATVGATTEAVRSDRVPPPTATEGSMGQARYCGSCGSRLEESSRFCPNCGRPVYQTAQVSTSHADVQVPSAPYSQHGEGAVSGVARPQAIYYWLAFIVLGVLALAAGDDGTAFAFIGVITGTVWVYRDAKSRGMDAGLWAVGVFFLFIVFFPLYFFKRRPRM